MMHYSKSVLLSSTPLDGLFPGQLDEDKEPLIFMKDTICDSYRHVTFEVPFLLWNYAKASSTTAAEIHGSSSISTIQAQFTIQEIVRGDKIFAIFEETFSQSWKRYSKCSQPIQGRQRVPIQREPNYGLHY